MSNTAYAKALSRAAILDIAESHGQMLLRQAQP